MTVLVTGGSGLVGTAVLELLVARGVEAVCFDRDEALVAGVATVAGDVRDEAAVRAAVASSGARAVVHLAGMVGVATDADPHTATLVNVVGTSNVLEAARAAGVRRVVLASSIMREAGRGLPNTGGDFPGPRNLYGAHKLVAELEADRYRELHGLDPVAVAIAGTLGAGTRPASPSRSPHLFLLQRVAAGEPARLEADGRWQLPLRRTAQIAELFVGAATAGRVEPFYNAGGRQTTLAELVDSVRRLEPGAEVELLGGSWSAIDPVDSRAAERDFGLVEEPVDTMVALTLADLRALLATPPSSPAPGA